MNLSRSLLFSGALVATSLTLNLHSQEAAPAPAPRPPRLNGTADAIDLASGAWDNVINIEVSVLFPDYREPWNAGQPSGGSGTGFLIAPNRFMTNAHVVSNATRVMIRTTNDPEPHPAKIVFIAHDCDLAIIEAVNPEHFAKLKPLAIGGVPKLNTEVNVLGYPIGGDRISVTRGVVSRIDFRPYSHTSVDSHLAIQVDAAINPGNSGGPVLQDGKVVGVAFQGYSGRVAQNVGYMIPTPVIKRFLKDVEDGSYDYYVDLSVDDFPIENPAQVKALKLEEPGVGVMIGDVSISGSVSDVLKPGDVLLSLGGNPVYNNGLIRVDGDLVDMNEVVERKFAGDKVALEFIRDGKKQKAEVTLKRFAPYVKLGATYDERPRYLMYAGLLFQPLDRNLMDAHRITDRTVVHVFDNYLNSKFYVDIPEPVVLTTILPDEATTYLQSTFPGLVEEINGVKIKRLADVAEALKKDGDKPGFIVVKLLDKGRPIILKRSLADEAHPRIMQNYNIQEAAFIGQELK
ncbi:MAG: trypsin-like peptidase domain-containing protein [Verrucomicrobiaceae bacterium]|nr:trypsin-like peptidase domain-containing protein [Verrucomicrobiaceae bacterium]